VTEPRQQGDTGAAAIPDEETAPAPEASPAANETSPAPEGAPAAKAASNGRGLVELEHVKVYFPIKSGLVLDRHIGDVRAVDDVTLTIERGETLGLVGESGCGKSTVGRAIIRLYQPTAGTIRFDGQDITNLGEGEMRPLRRRMQMVFQDPFSSLNPRHSVGRMIGEPLRVHGLASGRTATRRVRELLEIVGLPADAGNARGSASHARSPSTPTSSSPTSRSPRSTSRSRRRSSICSRTSSRSST
jgi:ABC-type glutathione transport system ATPase component